MSSFLASCQPRNRWSKPQSSGRDPCLARLHQLQSRRPNTRRDPRRDLGLDAGSGAGWGMDGAYVEWGLYTCAADVFDPHAVGGCRGSGGRGCVACGERSGGGWRAQQGEDVERAWIAPGDCMGDTASARARVYHQRTPIRAPQAGIR